MNIKEIKIEDLRPEEFIQEKVNQISQTVGEGTAINALSGGVDSAAVTLIGHRALGERLISLESFRQTAGARLKNQCRVCGATNSRDAEFCIKCGQKLSPSSSPSPPAAGGKKGVEK